MARKNLKTTYAERYGDTIADGKSPINTVPASEIPELDKPEVQAAILRPETVDIQLDGGSLTLPTAITLGQSFERKTTQVIQALSMVVVKAVKELSGDDVQDADWFVRNREFIPIVVYKPSVQNVTADFLALLSGKAVAELKDKINASTVAGAFMLALRLISDMNAGSSKEKNVETK